MLNDIDELCVAELVKARPARSTQVEIVRNGQRVDLKQVLEAAGERPMYQVERDLLRLALTPPERLSIHALLSAAERGEL